LKVRHYWEWNENGIEGLKRLNRNVNENRLNRLNRNVNDEVKQVKQEFL